MINNPLPEPAPAPEAESLPISSIDDCNSQAQNQIQFLSNSNSNFQEMNGHSHDRGSDTDSNPDESPNYYQPISSFGDGGFDSDADDGGSNQTDSHNHFPNGHLRVGDDGIASLSLEDDAADDYKGSSEEEEDDEEEAARVEARSNNRDVIGEDERRRNALLRPENAIRVMEAMRGVSFGGSAPDWAQRVPEDQWIQQLQRIRQPPRSRG